MNWLYNGHDDKIKVNGLTLSAPLFVWSIFINCVFILSLFFLIKMSKKTACFASLINICKV